MDEVKKQVLGFTNWDASKKGRALNRLKGENLKRFTGLPDEVLQAALDDELTAVHKDATDTRSFCQDLTKFWAALPNAGYDPTTRFLSLPKGVYFLADQRYGRVVYVRDAYDELTAIILEMKPRPPPADTDLEGPAVSSNRLLVTGLPGSGKTFYQFSLMKELASRHATVVVDWASRDRRILFTSDGAYLGSKTSFNTELADPATYFLVDSQAPPEVAAITIATSSPSHGKTWEFRKRSTEKIMPPWAELELERALPLFPAVSPTLLRDRFNKWGGSIRWCLDKANDPRNEQAVEAGIAATNLQALLAAVGNPDKVSDRILHLIPDADLNRSHYVFASEYVEERVISKLIASRRVDLEIFLISSAGISDFVVIRGRLFEAFVHRILPLGGTFDIRDLTTGVSTQLKLPRRKAFEFKDLAEVMTQPLDVHCYPKAKNLESVDFLHQPDEMGQVTVNMQNDVSANGLRKAYRVLDKGKNGQEVFLTWVVPADFFNRFQKQRMGRISSRKFPIKQRVLKIPLRRHAVAAAMLCF